MQGSFIPSYLRTSFARRISRRSFQSSSPLATTAAYSSDVGPSTPPPSYQTSTPRQRAYNRQYSNLQEALTRGDDPTRVWSYYRAILNFLGYEKLPLEVHQEVLRRCSAPAQDLRQTAAQRMFSKKHRAAPHLYEGRFQTIIRNIRAMGSTPSLEDYHFIMEQFSAVGHYQGVMKVYTELLSMGLTPRTKTFGLCLQAIARRFAMPIPPAEHEGLVAQTRTMLSELTIDMKRYNVRYTSVNLDLTIRILKQTLDAEGFQNLMKWGYGIDLANPDCPPLEYLGTGSIRSDLGVSEQVAQRLPTPQPFSTAALNTTIDVLGQFGNVSKLVQAFEVLTQPLPEASQHKFASFDDDDDFGIAVENKSTFVPPSAPFNTTTVNTLLRHLSRAGHAVFLRHYLVWAIKLEKENDRLLRLAVAGKKSDQVLAPHFSINRGTLLPAFGLSNRDKNVGLMRWLSSKVPGIIRRKHAALQFYTRVRESRYAATPSLSTTSGTSQVAKAASRAARDEQSQLTLEPASLDEVEEGFPLLEPPKLFDIDLHISILERDIREIEAFNKNLQDVLARSIQRVKERLGRRLWMNKDIYLRTNETQRRRIISQERWLDIVQFKPRQGFNEAGRHPRLPLTDETLSARSLGTSYTTDTSRTSFSLRRRS